MDQECDTEGLSFIQFLAIQGIHGFVRINTLPDGTPDVEIIQLFDDWSLN
jgi:hypothetical protein